MEKIDWARRTLRLEKYLGLNTEQFAKKMGVAVRAVEDWENGKTPKIRDQYAMKALRKEKRLERQKEQKTEIIVKEVTKEPRKPLFSKDEIALLKEILAKELGATKNERRDNLIKSIWQKL